LIYGAIGSDVVIYLVLPSIVLLTIGMLFKSGSGTLPFWAPDVYEGSPALTTALMSTLAKVVSMATLFKLLTVALISIIPNGYCYCFYGFNDREIALRPVNVKRMLAFSGISHAGL
jgi:NADH-quinone oxidoreductase subunit N